MLESVPGPQGASAATANSLAFDGKPFATGADTPLQETSAWAAARGHTTELRLTPAGVARAFAIVVASLLILHVIFQTLGFLLEDEHVLGLLPLFNVGTERNLPTFYSSGALLLCSGLLAMIARLEWRGLRIAGMHWAGLAAVFFGLSCDEMLGFHERLIEPVRHLLGTSGAFLYAWVIPYGAFALAFGGLYTRFLTRLPRRSALLFVLSGAVYVAGALGMEMVGGYWRHNHGHGPIYVLFQTVEESLEMVGIVFFLYSLLDYVGREHDVRVVFGEG